MPKSLLSRKSNFPFFNSLYIPHVVALPLYCINFQFKTHFPPRHLLSSADGSKFAFAFIFFPFQLMIETTKDYQ